VSSLSTETISPIVFAFVISARIRSRLARWDSIRLATSTTCSVTSVDSWWICVRLPRSESRWIAVSNDLVGTLRTRFDRVILPSESLPVSSDAT
jgi:hypothetical protein